MEQVWSEGSAMDRGVKSIPAGFGGKAYSVEKEYPAGIEGNNCRRRDRIQRAFRRACYFLKKFFSHQKAVEGHREKMRNEMSNVYVRC
jgi:hypothetical protein